MQARVLGIKIAPLESPHVALLQEQLRLITGKRPVTIFRMQHFMADLLAQSAIGYTTDQLADARRDQSGLERRYRLLGKLDQLEPLPDVPGRFAHLGRDQLDRVELLSLVIDQVEHLLEAARLLQRGQVLALEIFNELVLQQLV